MAVAAMLRGAPSVPAERWVLVAEKLAARCCQRNLVSGKRPFTLSLIRGASRSATMDGHPILEFALEPRRERRQEHASRQ